MRLQEKLDRLKIEFEKTLPVKDLEIMHRVTNDLRDSDILSRALKVGDLAPEFSLLDEKKQMVHSTELISKGPLIVSFYRGVW